MNAALSEPEPPTRVEDATREQMLTRRAMATILPAERQFEIKDSFGTFQANLGVEVRATLTRLTRYSAVVEHGLC